MVVVFDLDDTLYKERDYVESAFCFITKELGQDEAYHVLSGAFEAGEDAFLKCNEQLGLTIPKEQYLQWYRNHRPVLMLDENIRCLLKSLVSINCHIGLLTDGRTLTQKNKIEALGLLEWVAEEDIVISESFGSEKPSQRNYEYFMERHGGCPSDYYYIGDNLKKDFVTPNRLGWHTVCLLDNGKNIHRQDFNIDRVFLPEICIKDFSSGLSIFSSL